MQTTASDKTLLAAVVVLGFSAIVTQTILVREFLSVFSGNELVIGVVLANWMILTGFGISLSTTIAVLQGLLGKDRGKFVRTPKLNRGNARRQNEVIDRAYIQPLSPIVWGEIALGVYALLSGMLLGGYVGWDILPWMMIYASGYFYIAGLNLVQHIPRSESSLAKSFAGLD